MYTYTCIVHSDVRKEILKLYNLLAAPTFLYGWENWNLIKLEEGKIKETDESCEAICMAIKHAKAEENS
jgi:hypothetical protein